MTRPAAGRSEVNRKRPFGRCLIFLLLAVASFAAITKAQDLEVTASQILTGNIEQKRNALARVRDLRTEAASRLAIPALTDTDEIVRSMAAVGVVYLPPDEGCSLVLPLLNDKAEFVRREAAFALGEIGSAAATEPLIQVLQRDRSNIVRSAAAAALGKAGEPRAVRALVSVLQKGPKSSDEYLRRAAARSIGQVAEVIRGVPRQAATPHSFLPDKYKRKIASASASALSPEFGPAVAVLLKAAADRKETDDTRREAAYALGAIGDPAALAFLKANVTNKDNYLAEICREALLKMPGTE